MTIQEDLFVLIQERYNELNELLRNLWISLSDKPISLSEWNLISKLYEGEKYIFELTKKLAISRQATHKLCRQLEEKGIVEIVNSNQNKRNKCISLTPFGEQCYVKYIELKNDIEKSISENIGVENVLVLKNILKQDWGI